MNEYVGDTHAVLWGLFAQSRLGKAARALWATIGSGAVKIYVPAIAVSEMIMVVEKQRLPGVTMPQLLIELRLMEQSASYEFLPLTHDLAITSRTLTVIPDIFDRLIIAEALRLNLPLITCDSVIHKSGVVNVIWD